MQQIIRNFYFEKGPIKKEPADLSRYVQMISDMNFVHPVDELVKIHAPLGITYYYQ